MIFKGLQSRVWAPFPGGFKMRPRNLNDVPEEKSRSGAENTGL